MFSFLKNHPFAVEAFFESSLVLTFAVPKEEIQHLIPDCLHIDTHQDKWAFIAIAMVQTKSLRPKGIPAWLGNDFFLIGYRVFVRYTTRSGRKLRGLYILKSETDKKNMEFFGNVFTHYNYSTTDIQQVNIGSVTEICSVKSAFDVRINQSNVDTVSLPIHSPFTDWKEARRFAGPLPFTFTVNADTKKVLIIEGVRENWAPIPVQVLDYHFSFIEQMHLNDIRLANAFIIRQVPYFWKKGKLEQWN